MFTSRATPLLCNVSLATGGGVNFTEVPVPICSLRPIIEQDILYHYLNSTLDVSLSVCLSKRTILQVSLHDVGLTAESIVLT